MDDLQELIGVFARTTREDKMKKLFEELFTVKEKYDIALRWRLMKELYKGVHQREISHALGISLCKITRGSKILKEEHSVCKELIEELSNEKQI